MKKILAMLLMCMVLCVLSTAALAAKVTFSNYEIWNEAGFEEKSFDVSEDVYTLPEFGASGLTLPEGKKFYGWQVIPMQVYYKPGSKIGISKDTTITPYFDEANQKIFEAKYISREYNEHNLTAYSFVKEDENVLSLTNPYYCGFGTVDQSTWEFDYWRVEGEFEPYTYDYGPDVGWLFSRAIAAESQANMKPEDMINVYGEVTITAVWKNSGNNGGNNDDGNGGGNTDGGNGGGNTDGGNGGGNTDDGNGGNTDGGNGAAAENLPKTGDESSLALWMALLAMTGAVLVLLRKRTYN